MNPSHNFIDRLASSAARGVMSMQRNLLVTHRISDTNGAAVDVAELLESFGEWVEVEPAVYVLWTSLGRGEVLNRIRSIVDASDGLTVIDITGCSFGPAGVSLLPAPQADTFPIAA